MPNLLSHDLDLVLFGSFQQIIGGFWGGSGTQCNWRERLEI